jgi:hypothetical protein
MYLEPSTGDKLVPNKPNQPKKRRLKSKFRGKITKTHLENIQLRTKVAELERKLEGGWLSPNGEWCDVEYAARFIGRSAQRLRNMKSEGTGPMVHDESGAVRYKISDLERYMESGWGLRNSKSGEE